MALLGRMQKLFLMLMTAVMVWGQSIATAAEVEGPLKPHLENPHMALQQVFKGERFGNIVVSMKGTVIATWGKSHVRAKRSEDGGKTWGPEIVIAKPGFQPGGVTVNEANGDIIAFVEDRHPPAPIHVYVSSDDGKSWEKIPTKIKPDSKGNAPSMHMNEHGITLRHGKHKGRLIRPSRWYAGQNHRSKWPEHYTNAIYSDDGGKTWQTSEPFPAKGTGEALLAELSDGTLYYNSRRHWAEEGANPRMAGLTRLAVKGHDILIYSNCDSPSGRDHGTVWASFDGGKTWPIKKLVYQGRHAYSSMTSGRPGTITEGMIFHHFEGGPKGGSAVARFNLAWILDGGKLTGNGSVPKNLN